MAANTSPIYILTPKNAYVTISAAAANTAFDGSGTLGTTIFSLATAGSNGSKIQKIRIWHAGTNAAAVIRIYVNNGASNATPANNILIYEYAMAAYTSSTTAASVPAEITIDLPLAASNRLLVASTIAATSGYAVSCEGGDL